MGAERQREALALGKFEWACVFLVDKPRSRRSHALLPVRERSRLRYRTRTSRPGRTWAVSCARRPSRLKWEQRRPRTVRLCGKSHGFFEGLLCDLLGKPFPVVASLNAWAPVVGSGRACWPAALS